MARELSPYCVYTTADPERIKSGTISESRKWTTGRNLFHQARAAKQDMPIVFSDAVKNCSTLIYTAIISEIRITDRGTQCRYENLRKLPQGKYVTQQLILRKSNRAI